MTARLARTIECFAKERAGGPRILTVPLRPHLMGVPHRVGFLERFLDALAGRKDAFVMTGAQIADWIAGGAAGPAGRQRGPRAKAARRRAFRPSRG